MGASGVQVEVVVARYCEDLSWLKDLPRSWKVRVYDKSQGGPRQGLKTEWYASPDGPDSAELFDNSIPLENVGAEAHTYIYHICQNYDRLAEITLFLQGNPMGHVSDFVSQVGSAVMKARSTGYGYLCHLIQCDNLGRPHHQEPLHELGEMFRVFEPDLEMPRVFEWHGSAQFAVRKERIQNIPSERWFEALKICRTKLHACGMERLWYTLLAPRNARVRAVDRRRIGRA